MSAELRFYNFVKFHFVNRMDYSDIATNPKCKKSYVKTGQAAKSMQKQKPNI